MEFITGLPSDGVASHIRRVNKALSECKAQPLTIVQEDRDGITVVTSDIPGTELQLSRNIRKVIFAIAESWVEQLKKQPLPPLYKSGVRYQAEPADYPCEVFSDPYSTFLEGWGDCDDLVIWRIAEVLAAGGDAYPQAIRKIGTTRYHVAVRHANGDQEDPSIILYPGKFRPNASL